MLMKLKLFKEAELELKQFEQFNKYQFFYEFHPQKYPNRKGNTPYLFLIIFIFIRITFQFKGSMIPFGLRMLDAELAQYLGRSDESVCRLHKLLAIVDQVIPQFSDVPSKYYLISSPKIHYLK